MAYIVRFSDGEKFYPDEGFAPDDKAQREIMRREVWKHIASCSEIPKDRLTELPKKTIVSPHQNFWPDAFPIARARAWAVSKRFKDTVEALQPLVHDFYPLELVNRRDEPWGKTYFTMHVRTCLEEFVDLERTDGAEMITETHKLSDGTNFTLTQLRWRARSTDRLVLDKSKIADLHVWRGGGGQFTGRYFFSDKLVETLLQHEFSELDFSQQAYEM